MNGARTVSKDTCLYAEDYAFSVADTHAAPQDLAKVQVSIHSSTDNAASSLIDGIRIQMMHFNLIQ